ncbi:MAG TPA: 50S ribosomal protein L18 [Verrucomicrobiota bacterium]|nr:50S ribosomal protein L18 [Verrucomicrobiota bacterium]HNT13329.1 50S ribosomal protein L18 [Verrucomicrobiota bacterium]
MQTQKKRKLQQLRRWRVRKKVVGTAERPRMSVVFTGMHIYVQFIDDTVGRTLAAASTRSKTLREQKLAANVAGARTVGSAAARAALDKGIKAIVFDRGSAKYHGKVKALADAARETGLQF